jgi:tetratricopeptide (TPR) repeat protein
MKRLCHRIGPILLMALVLGATGGCTKQVRTNRLLKAANRDFNAEKYDDAEIKYKSALRLGGLNPVAVGQLGRLYAKEGRLMEAHTYLAKATELQPNSLPFQLALGQVDVSYRDFTNAAKIARRILSAQPTNEEALILLVDSSRGSQQLRQEVQSLPRAAENPAYHLALGMVALRRQKLDEAGNELRLALAANPKSSQAYFALAEFYALQRNGKEERQAFKKAAELAPPRSTIRSKYIEYLMQTGAVEEGRKLLQEMSEKAPDYIPGWVALMNLAMAEKKYDDAAKFADSVLERDERNYEALMGRGRVSLEKNDGAKAVDQFEHMNSIYKKSPQVKYELALAYLMDNDKVKASASLDHALALNPGDAQSALLLAHLEIQSGDPAAAVALLTRFIKRSPGIGEANLLLAEAYLQEQKPESAIAIYRNLSEDLPKNPKIPLLMGIVLAGQGKNSEARAAFEKSLELRPDYMPAVQQLINLDLAGHQYNEATALAQAQISKNPKAAELWEILAKIDVTQTNMARAETELLKAIDLNPDLPGPYLLLAHVYVHGDKYQDALQKLNALAARTNAAPAFMQIAAIHDKLKQFEAARDAYEKVLSINPKSVAALNNLAYLYAARLNNIGKAYELAQKAREILPDNPNIGDTLGWILFEKGDYPRALTILEDSAEKAPAEAEIQFHLGMAHYVLDEEDAARVALQRAVASPQEYPNKDEARSRLAVLNMDSAGAGASVLAGLEKALQDHPNDVVILARIGMLQEHQGAFDKAAATYETALKQTPGAVPIMAKLARLYAVQLNQPGKALSLATAAHKLAPDNADVSGILGHLVFHTGDFVWALSLLESAADRFPNQPELLYDLAWAYYGVGRIADAETAMQKALQSGAGFADSDDAKRFVALADAFNSASKVQAATGEARKILQAQAKYVPALMVSGAAEERAGNFKAAHDAYDQALAVFPLFAPAARQLAILDARHFSDDANGYTVAEKARTSYPDDPEVALSLGILSYHRAQYARSAELLRESMAQSKDDGELYYYLGMDYYQLKRTKESKQALDRALTLKIPDKLAAEAKRILAGLK